jgi:hypothetical protein
MEFFTSKPAVSHKEIIQALKEGIMIVGASCMGALRAAELDSLGNGWNWNSISLL